MKRPGILTGILVGVLITAPMIAILWLANRLLGLPFLPFDLFDWVTRVLPGPIITFGIDTMINTMLALNLNVADTAKTAEQLSAILQFVAMGAVTGGIFFGLLRWRKINPDTFTGLVIGVLFGAPLIVISLTINQSTVSPFWQAIWLGFVFLGWGVLLAWAYRRLSVPVATLSSAESGDEVREVSVIDRRQFLIRLGATSAAITVVGGGLAAFLASQDSKEDAAVLDASMAHDSEGTPDHVFPNSDDPVMPAPGTRPEYTPVKDHYSVFLRTEPTVIPEAGYLLPITGLVANPMMMTLDDIHNNYDSFDQYVTLSCISGRVGTSLISTTQWTGVSLQDLLADWQPKPEARYLDITSGDGFHESLALEMVAADPRIMLCHSWDGNKLPTDHGFPLRVWLPDHFGMKQPKWITGIEVTDKYTPGYWVERRWDEVAQVKTTSVIDTVAVDAAFENNGQQFVPIGGIAWAGDRGISKVEVRMDGGDWTTTKLRSPLSETTWVIWRIDWPYAPGEHTFEVRCEEADGTPQIERTEDARPSGATGIDSVQAAM